MVAFPTLRSRSRDFGLNTGVIISGGVEFPQTRTEESWACSDVIGNYGGQNEFSLSKLRMRGSECTDKIPTAFFFKKVPLHIEGMSPKPVGPSLGSYTNRILAQTGPLTPKVYLPVALFELKDLPKMLKHAGDLLHKLATAPLGLSPAKEGASAVLAYQFGWNPLREDIGKMLDLAKIIANRQKILQGAHTQKGVRRKIALDQTGSSNSGDFYAWSTYGRLIELHYTQRFGYKTWGVCHWRVRDPAQIGRPPSWMETFNAALSLNKGNIPVNVWKALPWSWAIDWFAGISDLLNAGHNYIDYEPFNITVMRTSYSEVVFDPLDNALYSVTTGTKNIVWKERYPYVIVNPSLTLKLPFIDNFKLSILGAFTVLGIHNRGR